MSLQFLDGTYLYLSTMPLNTAEGGYVYNGNSYLARIVSETFSTTQARSEYGIDRIPSITLKLADQDYFLWLSYEMAAGKGFCGAILTASLILMDISPTTGAYVFTSDAPAVFTGICDPPARENDGGTITLTAQSSHNMGKVYQPYVQVMQRCPWVFPVGAANRLAGGTDPSSNYWFCGYNPDQAGTDPEIGGSCERGNTTTANLVIAGVQVTDAAGVYIACDYTKSGQYGCVAHGMYSKDSAGRQTGRFGGEQWATNNRESRSKSYTQGKNVTVFSATNTSIYTDRIPMLYGQQWVIPPIVVNELGDANSTRGEAIVCMGDIGTNGVYRVVLNGIIIPRNTGAGSTDALQRWNFTGGGAFGNSYGSRNGAATNDAGFNDGAGNPQGDPHGSHATIEWVVYSELLQSSDLPTMQILAFGPRIWVYSNPTSKALQFSNSPAWVLMDLLVRSNWTFAQLDIQSFITAAQVAYANVTYTTLTGASKTHARFLCELVIHQRRASQEVIQMVLRCFNAQLVPNSSTGLLQLIVRQTLADQQPSPITGSNYATPINSLPGTASQTLINTYEAGGTTGSSGYVAWMFDEASIYRPASADGQGAPRLRVYTLPNLQRPNTLSFPFQDSDNSYAQDSLTLSDEEAINRAGGYNGAVQNTESYQVLGISNFDQAIRIANVYLAEQNHGNPEGDARGTYYFEIESTVRIEHLRVGNIALVQNQSLSMNGATPLLSAAGASISGFLARVAAITPTTDFERSTVTLAWHEDIWYTDLFGQAPAPFYSAQARGVPARPPFAWSPYGEQPISGDALWATSDWGFAVSQSYTINADGTAVCRVAVSGCPPVNKFAPALSPPLAALQGTTAATGGSIPGNQNLYLMLSGVDANGLATPISQPCLVAIPAGTNTNTAAITGIYWPAGTVSWILYGGIDQQQFCEQATGTGSPSSIQINSLNVSTYGAPDPLAQAIYFRWKKEIHGGIWGAQDNAVGAVGSDQITFGGGNFGGSGWAGRIITKIANLAGSMANIPMQDFLVTASSGNMLYVTPDPAAAGVQVGDVFEMRCRATVFSSTTIGDAGFVNGFSTGLTPDAEKGNRVRIIAGTARNQERTIASNTSTVLTVDTPFDVTPDATSVFVVLESAWQGTYDVPYTAATLAPTPAPVVGTLDVTNYKSQTIFLEALVQDAAGTTALEYFSPFRELYVWGNAGTQGTSSAPAAPNVSAPSSGLACAGIYADANNVMTPNPVPGGIYGLGGYLTLPVSDPNYSHLKQILVYAWPPGATTRPSNPIATMTAPFSVIGSQFYWMNPNLGPTIPSSRNFPEVEFVCLNDNANATPGPYTYAGPGGAGIAVPGYNWTAAPSNVIIMVAYQADVGGNIQVQVSGVFTPPSDAAYAYSTAGLFVHNTTTNGLPLSVSAVSSWTGPWFNLTGTASFDVILRAVDVNGLDSGTPVIISSTNVAALNMSLAAALAYINGGSTSTGSEIPNISGATASAQFGINAEGTQWWALKIGAGGLPADTRFLKACAVLCATATLNGAISNSQTNITVNPTWGFGNGDVFFIDSERMQLTSGAGTTSWTVVRNATGGSSASTYAGTGLATHANVALCINTSLDPPNCQFQGMPVLQSGQLSSTSQQFPIGGPQVYVCYLVSVSQLGTWNTWPVPGVTPEVSPFPVNYQGTGSLNLSFMSSASIGVGLTVDNGKLITVNTSYANQIDNPNFSLGPSGMGGWTITSGAPVGNVPTGGAGPVATCCGLGPHGQVAQGPITCNPGDSLSCYFYLFSPGGADAIAVSLNFYSQTGVLVGNNYIVQAPGSAPGWTKFTLSGTAPANTSYFQFAAGSLNAPNNEWYITDVVVQQAPPVGNGITTVNGALAFNGSSEFTFSGGQVNMLKVDLSKAINMSAQFAVTSGQFGVSSLQIGGVGSPLSLCKFFDGATLYGFIGADTGYGGSGYTGAWFKRCGIGGSGPLSPAIFADSNGNVAISGSLIAGGTIASSAFVATGGNFIVNVDSTNAILVTDTVSGSFTQIKSIPGGGSIVNVGYQSSSASLSVTPSAASLNLGAEGVTIGLTSGASGVWISLPWVPPAAGAPDGSVCVDQYGALRFKLSGTWKTVTVT